MATDQELLDLARKLRAAGNLAEAEKAYRQFTQLRPQDPNGWNELGIFLGHLSKYDSAAAAFKRAIQLSPRMLGAFQNLAIALERKKDYEQSEAASREALKIDPRSIDSWDALGGVLALQGKVDQAAKCFETAFQLQPDSNHLRFRLGKALYLSGEINRGVALLEEASRNDPGNLDTKYELVLALRVAGRHEDARELLHQILAVDPGRIEAMGTLAMTSLLLGDFKNGWRLYENRWDAKTFPDKKRTYTQPIWSGQEIAGKTVLIYGEQGAGDNFQFIRYAPLISERGAKVICECPSDLIPVIQTVGGIGQLITKGSALPAFDFHCPLMSLPLAFGTEVETIPANIPYIRALPQYIAQWSSRLAPYEKDFKVGLVWSGSPRHVNDSRRSMHLNAFAPLAAIEAIAFVSLQKGPGVAQANKPPPGMKLLNFAGGISHFGDTAGLIDGLDLVIAVDTAVAHLAGAMGKPVWMLLPYSPDWRWLLGREDTPWYPTMRLFRQSASGEWESVIKTIAEELAARVKRQDRT